MMENDTIDCNYLKNIHEKDAILSFSETASSVIKEKVSTYSNELIKESKIIAKKDQSDSISAKHVEIASKNLMLYSGSTLYKRLSNLGSLFLGTSLSTLTSMFLNNSFPVSGVLIVTFFGIVGSFILGKTWN